MLLRAIFSKAAASQLVTADFFSPFLRDTVHRPHHFALHGCGKRAHKRKSLGNCFLLSLEKDHPFKDDPTFDFTYDTDKSFISMVSVDVSKYLGSQEPVKKTLTIPKWADKLGRDMHLNFSKTLTDAITAKKLK